MINGFVIGWRVAYDVTLQIVSPWETAQPWVAVPLSLAGWLVWPSVAGTVIGYVFTKVIDARQRSSSDLIPVDSYLIPLLGGRGVTEDFSRYFEWLHSSDWGNAQRHWEKIVEQFLSTDAVSEKAGPRLAMHQAVSAAVSFLIGLPDRRCPLCPPPSTPGAPQCESQPMTSGDPRTRGSVAELSRCFLRQAYPDRPEWWIEQQVRDAVQRIDLAISQQRQHAYTAAGERWRRGIEFVLTAVVIITLVVAGIWLRDLLAAAAVRITWVYLLVGAAVMITTATLWSRNRRAKVLSCRVRINSRLDFEHFDAGDTLSFQGPGGSVIEDPGMVVVHVKNLGGATIEPEDYQLPLRLRFPERRVVSVNVAESEPLYLQNAVAGDPGFRVTSDSITMPEIRLGPQDSFKMVIVLSGTKVGARYEVPVDGRLRDGRITTESNVPRMSWPTILAAR